MRQGDIEAAKLFKKVDVAAEVLARLAGVGQYFTIPGRIPLLSPPVNHVAFSEVRRAVASVRENWTHKVIFELCASGSERMEEF